MSTPFPGMDPYLEHPALWTGFHTRFLVAIANQIGPLIRPRYIASVEERVFLEGPEQQRIPDVWVQKVRDSGPPVAVAERATSNPLIVELDDLEVREAYIEILDRYHGMKVVTVLEVVSPSNKAQGAGRKSYLAKRRETLASKCHLVEIDLLRTGRHVLRVPRLRVEALTSLDYLASVNRWPKRKRFEVYPCRLRERLPAIMIPLADPDPDVPLDLQLALEKVYDEGSYALRIDYDAACEPSLPSEEQEWARERWQAYRNQRPELSWSVEQ